MEYDQKILIIRFSSIGDIVLSTSPLRTIRIAYPEAQITFLTLETFAPLLEYHPDIDILLSINPKSTLRELWNFADYLQEKKYKIIFDLHNSIRSNILLFRISAKFYQIKKPRIKRLMLFLFHRNDFASDFSILTMYHDTFGHLLKDHSKLPHTKLIVSNHEIKEAQKMLLKKGIFNDFITIIPGAAWPQKQWPAENYIETLKKINMPVVLLGSEHDRICFDISSKLDNVVNLAGKTSLRQALAIMANAQFIIGSDTGLVHAAEALGKHVNMILGPTSSETGGGVNLLGSNQIQKEVWCRPCSQNGKLPCYRKSQVCLESITPKDVINSLVKC